MRILYIMFLFLLLISGALTSCSTQNNNPAPATTTPANTASVKATPTPQPTFIVDPAVRKVELDMLTNIKRYGFNADKSINAGLGGLYINWRYGTNPLQVNVNGTGETDEVSGATPRHDDLTDLRYVHNLLAYKLENPNDTSFDSELSRYTTIVKHEFVNTRNERGWLYDILIDMYAISHDTFYRDAALSLVQNYARTYDPKVGSIYKKNTTTNTQGSYRVDNVLEAGCALVQAGTQFAHPDWVEKGKSIINFLYTHAYIPRYSTFPSQIGNVLQPDGTLNPQQPFYTGRSSSNQGYAVDGGMLRMGNLSQIILSLLDTYQVTHEQAYLTKASELLDSFSLPDNTLRMWDTQHNGYFYAVKFSGSSPSEPGTITIDNGRKEAGRQAIMLQVYHLANKLTNNHYMLMEERMREAVLKDIYMPEIHGVTYLVNADWSALKFKNGTLNNMVTTEAMGAALESLFSLSR